MNFLQRLFQSRTEAAPRLVCPHCEREMAENHDLDACARRFMSRRFFFGVVGAGVATAALAPQLAKLAEPLPGGQLVEPAAGITGAIGGGNCLLTAEQITAESLRILNNKLQYVNLLNCKVEHFVKVGGKIGDMLRIRRPRDFHRF